MTPQLLETEEFKLTHMEKGKSKKPNTINFNSVNILERGTFVNFDRVKQKFGPCKH